jgi:hypothetical protein
MTCWYSGCVSPTHTTINDGTELCLVHLYVLRDAHGLLESPPNPEAVVEITANLKEPV